MPRVRSSTAYLGVHWSDELSPAFRPAQDRTGLFIQSPALAQQVLKLVDVIRQQGAYKVALAANGKDLVWTTIGPGGQEQVVEEPETDVWTRFMLEALLVIAPEGLL